MQLLETQKIGPVLAISGTVLTLIGTIFNSFLMDHAGAMGIWFFSNPLMLAWAVGYFKGYWDGGLSAKALMGLYFGLTLFNTYGLFVLGATPSCINATQLLGAK